MPYIKYSEKTDEWKRENLGAGNKYVTYFQQKLDNLQTVSNQNALKTLKKAKEYSKIINGQRIIFNDDEIAEAATSKISGYTENIATLYQQVISNISKVQSQVSQQYSTAASQMVAYIQSGQANGINFSIDLNSSDAFDLVAAAQQGAIIHRRGSISNTIGDIGEGVSALAGKAIVETLLEQIEKQIGKNAVSNISARYVNKGKSKQGTYRSQTDNELQIEFTINPSVNGGQPSVLSFSYNISDKANSKLAKLSEKTKSTSRLNIRNSTVNALLKDTPGGEEMIYNTISYHRDLNDKRYSGMHSTAGTALRAYAGYKLLLETFLDSKKHQDEVNFTVYGNKIIPEHTVLSTLLEQTKIQTLSSGGFRGGKFRYLAEIRYWILLKSGKGKEATSAVKSVSEAEKLIRSMPVQIGTSLKI